MINNELEDGFIEANRMVQTGEYTSAIKILLKYKKKHPSNSLVNFNLGVAYYKAGIFIKSIYCLEEAVKQGADSPEVFNQLGLAHDKNDDLPGARAYYKKALDQDPFFSMAWNNMGVSYFLAEDYLSARAYFEKALEINNADPDAWFNLRDTYLELGLNEEAGIADEQYHALMRH